ncbi:MAG: response regulator transcription factor [Flavobacterium sp.]|nr:response regulator transcription factor [Pedobacter sp.]
MQIRIAIAEDNSLALKVCIDKLSFYPEYKIVLKAFNGEELVGNIEKHQVDLILMDIQMPGMGGIECARRIKLNYPQIKILMLTTFDDDENIFQAIMAGASGYLLKEETAETLHEAIYDTLSGGAAMSPGIALKVLNLIKNPLANTPASSDNFSLTKREVELLEHLKNGFSYEKIASNLSISYGTVRKHIENIYRKLQVGNKMDAVRKASNNRLI